MASSDSQLMGRLQGGDLEALERLFAAHSGAIFGFFYRTTGSSSAGEDLTQEVFLRVLRYRSGFRTDRPFRTWLFGIARNVLADHHARRRPETAIEELTEEPASTGPLALERLERDERQTFVRDALDRLEDRDRELLVLSRFHDLRHAELAELFDCSPGAIKVRLHRALKRLAATMRALRTEVGR